MALLRILFRLFSQGAHKHVAFLKSPVPPIAFQLRLAQRRAIELVLGSEVD